MKLDELYMRGSRGIGVKFIQMVVNEYTEIELVIDGIWGIKTEEGVRSYQELNNLLVDGKVGVETFPAMAEDYPGLWARTEVMYSMGKW